MPAPQNQAAGHRMPGLLLWLWLLLLCQQLQAEILHAPFGANRIAKAPPSPPRCPTQTYHKMLHRVDIDDVEDLDLGVPVNIALEQRKEKRFVLKLNNSTPLTIQFSAAVKRKLYYNQTANILRTSMLRERTLVFPCALSGQYDLFVEARQSGELKIEAQAQHPQHNWPLLNHTHRIAIRTQNRVRKREMIVKWDRSKFDYHVMHYCLVVNSRVTPGAPAFASFCDAVYAWAVQRQQRPKPVGCSQRNAGSLLDQLWSRTPNNVRKLEAQHSVNIICTGNRTRQLLQGLEPHNNYQLQIFGVHQKRRNLTLLLATTRVHFNRTHPTALRSQAVSMLKIGGLHGVQVYSFKVPPTAPSYIRYLLLPCSGSEIRVKLLRQREQVAEVDNIYRPTYIKQSGVKPGERYLIRFEPSNEDEALRAQKVKLVLSSDSGFRDFPQLPEDVSVYDAGTHCTSTTIAWHDSPDERALSYCVIVFNLPQRNRSSADYTNYCMDFDAQRVVHHRHFDYMHCHEKQPSNASQYKGMVNETIINLTPGASYLIYVTANLSMGKPPVPYESLTVHMARQCADSVDLLYESHEQPVYY